MARLARFERAAFRLGGERSILLSYGGKYEIYEKYREESVPLYSAKITGEGAK